MTPCFYKILLDMFTSGRFYLLLLAKMGKIWVNYSYLFFGVSATILLSTLISINI